MRRRRKAFAVPQSFRHQRIRIKQKVIDHNAGQLAGDGDKVNAWIGIKHSR